jgi:preprotein translocase SecF subunit
VDGGRFVARLGAVFDVIGKRRWFFAFSLLITIPGLIFILLTPFSGGKAGLKFSIDYTGGTVWTIRFADASVTAGEVQSELAALGHPDAEVVQTGQGLQIRLTTVQALASSAPTATPVVTLAPSPSASPVESAAASTGPSGSAVTASASLSASSSAPAPSGSAGASAATAAAASPESTTPSGGSSSPSAAPSAAPSASASAGPGASASLPPVAGNTTIPTSGELGRIATALQARFGPIAEQNDLTTIGAVVSSDLIQQALILILVGSAGILLWVTFRFRDVKFGVTALIALLHDVIVVVGTFAILGTLFGVQINALFVTAMLTVIGFSVHDTIVVFDRVRENKARHVGEPFAEIVNHSLLQTFGRSITTSLTVVLTLLALLLFGGAATSEFVLALLIGIISGTYSSIFNASPLLVVWQEWEDRRKGRQPVVRSARRVGA